MDKHTFGDSASAIMLTNILDANPSYRRKVSAMIHDLNTINRELTESNLSIHLKKSFLRTTLDRFKLKASNLKLKEIETFTQNVIKQSYRRTLTQL